MHKMKVVLDTDIFGDADDLFSLFILLADPRIEIAAIVTVDELQEQRAYALYSLLQELGISTPIYHGMELGNTHYFLLEPRSAPAGYVSRSLTELAAFIQKSPNKLEYLCIGPASNVSVLLDAVPTFAQKVQLTCMGGSFSPIFGKAEHNVRLDTKAAQKILSQLQARWVLATHTVHPTLAIAKESTFFNDICNIQTVSANWLQNNLELFFSRLYPESFLHDPLAALSLTQNFISFKKNSVVLTDGIFVEDPSGNQQEFSNSVNYEAFRVHFNDRLIHFLKNH